MSERVAIIGGGCAAMAAAFELTRPDRHEQFEVTVYQQGWRLGGKGASGRGPAGRIEEHGLHVWMGFYENAFRLMRAAYAELGRDPSTCPIATWRDAFEPAPHVGLADWTAETGWELWSTVFPAEPGEPGDPLDQSAANPFTPLGYFQRAATVSLALLRAARGSTRQPPPPPRGPADALLQRAAELAEASLGGAAATLAMLEQRLELLARLVRVEPLSRFDRAARALLSATLRDVRALPALEVQSGDARRAAEVLEIVLVAQLGALRDDLLRREEGFAAIDHLEFRQWLRRHGASDAALRSAFIRGLYSLMFAYADGDENRPAAAAGQALRGCLRMFFTYRGAFFWKMTAGMGDIVFAPLYEVLRRRGVRFEFFHRLTNVGLGGAPGDRHVRTLRFDVQAAPVGEEYEPLVDVGGVPSWPAEPLLEQLEGAEELGARRFESYEDHGRVGERELTVSDDFDFVVLGVGLGALPHVCAELIEENPRWRAMVDNLATVATQALQLWFRPTTAELGWDRGPVTLTAYTAPFDTWSDMSHLLRHEAWDGADAPRSVGYFCHVLDERHIAPTRAQTMERVREHSSRFIQRDLPRLLPGLARDDGGIRWELVESQYWTCNVDPSERYVQCLPGTPGYRISPLDRTYDNLTVAGDWTSCGLNLGCVEAAVMSGMLAANALREEPDLSAIIGYEHPLRESGRLPRRRSHRSRSSRVQSA